MREYMEIGSTPYDETCAQVGTDNYKEIAEMEIAAYINLLERMFPEASSRNINFKKKWFQHDFGSYAEVCMYWNTDDEEADSYVYEIERNLPACWDRMAKQELGLEETKVESKDNGNWS
jgi:ArsR family metal-binding transcriptional regulator